MEDDKSLPISSETHQSEENNNSHGWQKVTYAKKHRKNQPKNTSDSSKPNGSEKTGVFNGVEKHAEERRRKLEAQRAASIYDDDDEFPVKAKKKKNDRLIDDDDDDDDELSSDAKENNAVEANKKEKPKKVKKPKVTVAEAASKIDGDDLAAFLSNVSESYEGQQDIQLMRFADYFGHAFSAVSASQFPWLKLFRESAVVKIADIPASYISEVVYKTSVDWINHHSNEALGTFVLWSLDSVLADMAIQQSGSKGSKKGGQGQPASSKSQVAIFLVLAMVLRRKPDVLINLSPKLRENAKYQGQDKLPVIVWMIVQACLGDLAVGLYLWAQLVLPMLGGKLGSNPQSRDLVLQLVERILAAPKARSILVNSAVRKGERLLPPAALDLLLHVTFPAAKVKATERFEAVYPVLKEVALAGSPGSKAMKQVSQQIQSLAVKAAGEGIPALSQEAASIFIWSLTQNPDCYKQWDKIYVDNIEASVIALRKLVESWKEISSKQSSAQALAETLKSFRQKNEKALNGGVDASRQALFKEADKYCKTLSAKLSSGFGCVKTMALAMVVLGVAAVVVSPNLEEGFDWEKFQALFQQ